MTKATGKPRSRAAKAQPLSERVLVVAMPQQLIVRLFERKLVPFLGAGCSMPEPSNLPSAQDLADWLISRAAGSEGQALEDIAEEACERGGWQAFAQLLPLDEWRARPPNLITRVVAELCVEGLISQILTTNWDLLVERALGEIGQPYSKVVDASTLAIEPSGKVTLIKLNGCVDHAQLIKASRTQIESQEWLEQWIAGLFDALIRQNSLLFSGYSGASRAATTTIAGIVEAGERAMGDFLVDRATPAQLAEASGSGAAFIAAVSLEADFTGDAIDFFRRLRLEMYPRLMSEPARRAETMAAALLAPTAAENDVLETGVSKIARSFAEGGPDACQVWARSTFATFPAFEHTRPYLAILPQADELANCMLILAAAAWAERLVEVAGFEFAVSGNVRGIASVVKCHVVAAHPYARRDAAARAALRRIDESPGEGSPSIRVGVAFGGIGNVEPTMATFSVARGTQVGNTARSSGSAMAWIDGDSLLSEFQAGVAAQAIRSGIHRRMDEAIDRAFPAAG